MIKSNKMAVFSAPSRMIDGSRMSIRICLGNTKQLIHCIKSKKEEKEKQYMIHVLLFFEKDRISNLYKCGT
jgi:hypothetical protein